MIIFTVSGRAVPKQRPRLGGRQAYTPKPTRDYEARVKKTFYDTWRGSVPVYPKGSPVRVTIEVAQEIPKSWSKTKRAKAISGEIMPTAKTGDLDNIAKSILDALNLLAYEDDCQVTTLMISKVYGEVPRAVIRIEEDNQ